ncbi:APC family permease [Lolliginicoccus levis]|uniref:APC family permease n=1 Tax=Lolliginicoccus levis TaxID=2919542 RepID=UPI00241E879C|nr:APC family permease [Lolliginicoccus levis]
MGAISMGTAVIIGAGIFALTGQIAELAGPLFPLAFIVGAIVTAFSAYSYVKLAKAFPSAGGIAMFLKQMYGPGTITAVGALFMYFSMVINESLVARTFGTYVSQLFGSTPAWIVPALGVGLLIFAFAINISGNRIVGNFSLVMSLVKIGGITLFGIAGLWLADLGRITGTDASLGQFGITGFISGVALAILAYKGFTTITNSGAEIKDPHRNVGRAIIYSIVICVLVYMLVALAVAGNLSLAEIVQSRNYALAEAARPAFGNFGLYFTVFLAIIATVSGVIASAFAVSRMLAMLTDMKLVPHSHLGMPGDIQKHTLVYTIALAILLTIFFDLSRIASLGVVFYLAMDIAIHWGLWKNLRRKIDIKPAIPLVAITMDLVVLAAFVTMKIRTDPLVIGVAALAICAIIGFEWLYLRRKRAAQS